MAEQPAQYRPFPPLPSLSQPHPSASTSSSPSSSTVSEEQRSDDDVRELWLKVWNASSDPAEASCRVAFDILWYCFSPAHQIRHVYQYGHATVCQRQRDDLRLCAAVKTSRLSADEARVRQRAPRNRSRGMSFVLR